MKTFNLKKIAASITTTIFDKPGEFLKENFCRYAELAVSVMPESLKVTKYWDYIFIVSFLPFLITYMLMLFGNYGFVKLIILLFSFVAFGISIEIRNILDNSKNEKYGKSALIDRDQKYSKLFNNITIICGELQIYSMLSYCALVLLITGLVLNSEVFVYISTIFIALMFKTLASLGKEGPYKYREKFNSTIFFVFATYGAFIETPFLASIVGSLGTAYFLIKYSENKLAKNI